jgi:hypothetical protein
MSPAELFADNFATVLSSACGVGDALIVVATSAPTGLQGSGEFRVLVDGGTASAELMVASNVGSGTTWSVLRGSATGESPTPTVVAHASGAVVSQVLTEGGLENALAGAAAAGSAGVAAEASRATASEAANASVIAAEAVPAWVANTVYPTSGYAIGQQVSVAGQLYALLTAHTSGSSFSGSGVNWLLLGQVPSSVVTGTGSPTAGQVPIFTGTGNATAPGSPSGGGATLTGGAGGGRVPLASSSYIDLCTTWSDGTTQYPAATPAVRLAVTFTSASTTATVTSGAAPASGAIIGDVIPPGTTFTASGSTLTLSIPATGAGTSLTVWAGQDATTALQAALNYFPAQNIDGTVEFSVPGVYLLNGAQQTGTSQTRAYSGTVLFPARAYTATPNNFLSIRIKGPHPYAGFWSGNAGGVALLGAAPPTGGAIFDSIGGSNLGSGRVFTSIDVTFEDLAVRTTDNPQGSAINATGLAGLTFRGSCIIDTPAPTTLTGSGYGVQWPAQGNFAMLHQSGELMIAGFPFGMTTAEHLVVEYVLFQGCGTAIAAAAVAHPVKINKACIQACLYAVAPLTAASTALTAFLDIGDSAPIALLNDPNNYILGEITVAATSYTANAGYGVPSNGGLNATIKMARRSPSAWPTDTFSRVNGNFNGSYTNSYTYGPGCTDRTGHIWSPTQAVTFPASGMQATLGGWTRAWVRYLAGRNNPSRVVRMKVTLGTTYTVALFLSKILSSNAITGVYVLLTGGQVNIQRVVNSVGTTVASSSAGAVSASAAHTIDAVISNPYAVAGLYTLTVYLDGVQVVTYTLSSSDATALADTEQFSTQDGFGMYGDTTTVINEFAVLPA